VPNELNTNLRRHCNKVHYYNPKPHPTDHWTNGRFLRSSCVW